jgi:hypothetical protein
VFPLALAPAHHAGVSALAVVAIAVAIGLAYGAAYLLSVRMHPWRPCRRCGESGKHRGRLFRRSFRACDRCGGTGMERRRFARLP